MGLVIALVGLALVVIVAAYIAQPFVVKRRAGAPDSFPSGGSPRDKLLAERDAIYAAIRDLDFDFQTGKLLEADYGSMRETCVARGVEILKQLDTMGATPSQSEIPFRGLSVVGGQADGIEAAVQYRRKRKAQAVRPASLDDEIEAAIRARRTSGQQPSAVPHPLLDINQQQCPSCGHPFDPTDRFCAKCGAARVEAT